MANLYFTVFEEAGSTAQGDVLQEGSVSFTGTAGTTVALTAATGSPRRTVRVLADADCFLTWGSDPTASSSDGRAVGSENPEYWHIKAGDKISAITR